MPKAVTKMNKRARKTIKKQRLSYLSSKKQTNKEGLYSPKRRVRVDYPSKVKILKRIESQNFIGATEQQTLIYYYII